MWYNIILNVLECEEDENINKHKNKYVGDNPEVEIQIGDIKIKVW